MFENKSNPHHIIKRVRTAPETIYGFRNSMQVATSVGAIGFTGIETAE
jgi:hypothetical protein